MSYAFMAALRKNPQQSYVQLLNSIRDELEGKYDQKPQLSCSHPLDTDLLFVSFPKAFLADWMMMDDDVLTDGGRSCNHITSFELESGYWILGIVASGRIL